MVIDVHCHYTYSQRAASRQIPRFSFEPSETQSPGAMDSFIAPRATKRLSFSIFQRLLGISPALPPGAALDEQIEHVNTRHLLESRLVDRFVLLAFDEYHDSQGRRLPPPEHKGQRGSDMYTSNSLVRAACADHPRRFLFGASIHPYRDRAAELAREVFDAGACLIKWLPLNQNIDVTDARTIAFMRACAGLGLPLLIHYGPEFTLTTQHPKFIAVAPLLNVLRELRRGGAMPTVIVAHVATPVLPFGSTRAHELLIEALLGEFADEPLYADISALTTWGKVGFMRRLAARQDVHRKLLFGTDFPVPLSMFRLRRDLRPHHREIASLPSWPDRAVRAVRAMGYNEIVMQRAATILPNINQP